MNTNSSDRIMIKKKHKYLNIILGIVVFILIAIVSGVVFSKSIIESILKEDITYMNEKEKNSIDEVFSKGITKIYHSIVTISDSVENLAVNVKAEGNVTGIIVDYQGYIVTSFEKVKGMNEILVKLPSLAKEPVKAVLIGSDEEADVAIIKIDSDNLIPVVINEEDVKEGNLAIAVGNSCSNDFIGMVTVGVVSSVNPRLHEEINRDAYKVIQTSAVINDGNVAGALCNSEGELIGFNSYTLNKEGGQLYYSLSAEDLKKIINDIIRFTDKLGISGQLIDDKDSGIRGLYIQNVTQDGNAAKAGLLPTDIILSIDEEKISSLQEIDNVIKSKKKGEDAWCEILRDGTKTRMRILFE